MQLPGATPGTGGQLPGTERVIARSGGLLPGARGGPEAGADPAPPGRPCGGGGASTGPPRTARAPASLPAAVPSSLRRGRTGRTGAAPHRAAPRRARWVRGRERGRGQGRARRAAELGEGGPGPGGRFGHGDRPAEPPGAAGLCNGAAAAGLRHAGSGKRDAECGMRGVGCGVREAGCGLRAERCSHRVPPHAAPHAWVGAAGAVREQGRAVTAGVSPPRSVLRRGGCRAGPWARRGGHLLPPLLVPEDAPRSLLPGAAPGTLPGSYRASPSPPFSPSCPPRLHQPLLGHPHCMFPRCHSAAPTLRGSQHPELHPLSLQCPQQHTG